MLIAALIAMAFTPLAKEARGFYTEQFTLNPQLETDCSGPPADNQVSVIPDVSYPFRTDYLTLHECKAYENVPCSPTESHRCDVGLYEKADMKSISSFYKTYFELDCSGYSWKNNPGGWRVFVRAYTKKFSIISPKRALTMKIRERSGVKDPLHSDIFEPVRGQVIDITVLAGASTEVTSKIYRIGMLPSLVALHIQSGKGLSIKRHDFNRIPNVRLIVFDMCSIREMEPYTFTDLPHLTSLSVEKGLWHVFRTRDRYEDNRADSPFALWNDDDLHMLYRIHCDCSFAWYRNFLNSKSELMEYKQQGTMAVIGSYMSEYFDPFGFVSYVASLDCGKNLTDANYQAGDQFSYNTTCFGPC